MELSRNLDLKPHENIHSCPRSNFLPAHHQKGNFWQYQHAMKYNLYSYLNIILQCT
jgi:hypothetical protein